ncbi:hypothetical protein BJF79_00835 [Actinomadura sp. CNU-125]|uniref:hypothetical protein n=1 Tax=Actinomadura sp. CNU-125 TaxID=1904961 RepID=UPI0009642733|nr:hypothetical protein [Actinomadura sp. CNU-125]OLT31752.1 hypothetical protein BJF79_00835 [Actinomadura sp. CNU-125]
MNHQQMTYADLDRLTGEILPRRVALSAGMSAPGHDAAGGHGGGGDGDTVIAYACQATSSSGTTGILGTGLLAQPAHSTLTCMPAAVVHDDGA